MYNRAKRRAVSVDSRTVWHSVHFIAWPTTQMSYFAIRVNVGKRNAFVKRNAVAIQLNVVHLFYITALFCIIYV